MDTETIFELKDITFSYPNQPVLLRDICLSMPAGRQVGLYGANGSGKSTLFRLIMGLVKPDQGQVLFKGRPLSGEKDFQALRRSVGLVMQNADDQLFCPTVLEDVTFGPLNLGLSPDQAREKSLAVLARLGLDGYERKLTHHLSGGEKKLVSLATVLVMEPAIILLDEPTNDLDPLARQRIIDILRSLPGGRMVISHDWDMLAEVSGEYLTIDQGRLLAQPPEFRHSHIHAHPLGAAPHDH